MKLVNINQRQSFIYESSVSSECASSGEFLKQIVDIGSQPVSSPQIKYLIRKSLEEKQLECLNEHEQNRNFVLTSICPPPDISQ